jgi:hypothetical protein
MFCQAVPGHGSGDLVMQDVEQAIRERAYCLWEESGCPEGNAEEHWLAAQREVLRDSLGTFARVSVTEPDASKKPAKPRKTKSKKAQAAA